MRQKEGILDDKLVKNCKENDVWVMKTGGQCIPDLVMCIKGRFISFETKVDKNEMSELQLWQKAMIEKAGGIVFEVRDFKTGKELIDLYIRSL